MKHKSFTVLRVEFMPHLRHFVLLDRDGTLIVHRPYLCDPQEVELLPEAVTGLKFMRRLGLGLILMTNQSGIGRGYFTVEQMHSVHDRLRQLLAVEGLELDDIYYCQHAPSEGCGCRKPAIGMVTQAAAKWGFDPREAFVIGDADGDMKMAIAVGAVPIRVISAEHVARSPREGVVALTEVKNLVQAAGVIERYLSSRSRTTHSDKTTDCEIQGEHGRN